MKPRMPRPGIQLNDLLGGEPTGGDDVNYRWSPPVLMPGEQSNFYDHTGRLRTGECVRVETWYRSDGEARHNYSMRVEGRARRINVGGDCIPQAAT